MKVRIDLELITDEVDMLQRRGILIGYMRVDPNKRWNEAETKEACREGLKDLIRSTTQQFPHRR